VFGRVSEQIGDVVRQQVAALDEIEGGGCGLAEILVAVGLPFFD